MSPGKFINEVPIAGGESGFEERRAVSSPEIAASVERTLREQSRVNELKVAYGRAVAVALAAVLDTALFFDPQGTIGVGEVSPANALLAAGWALAAVGIAAALRRGWYREDIADLMPLYDGVMILSLHALISQSLGTSEVARLHPVVVVAAASTMLAMTGALRLRRRASLASTVAGLAVFVGAASFADYTVVQTAFVGVMIASAGMLGAWISNIVRRAAYSEAQKTILTRFLPADLVEADPRAGLRLISEPRTVEATVMVSDLRGFTAMAEAMRPEETLALLNQIQGAFAEAVRHCGGTVDKFMGDGMLAVFGAPRPVENHAAAALAAAHDILAWLVEWNAASDGALRVGIGIHSGPLLFGCLGSGARLEFTVLGDTVNTASRLQELAKERNAAMIASGATVQLAGAALEPLGRVALRGREQPIEVYALRC